MNELKHNPICDVCWHTDGQEAPADSIAIVVDILRASTNIVTIFAQGAHHLAAVRDIDEARDLARAHQGLLVGERDNRIITGFDYGNSPAQLSQVDLHDQTVILTSTNFPHALFAARRARSILIGALVNLDAVCTRAYELARQEQCNITFMLAGEPSEAHAFEDLYFAGRGLALMAHRVERTDAARAIAQETLDLPPDQARQRSVHARELIEDGFEADVDFAFQLNQVDVVPRVRSDWIEIF